MTPDVDSRGIKRASLYLAEELTGRCYVVDVSVVRVFGTTGGVS
jgi:hypothetical protein